MRNRNLAIIAVTLTASVLAATLTGCGTRTKATDQEVVMEEEPIIVTDEGDSEEATIETEDEITETEEVIADDGEDILKDTENDEIVLYAEINGDMEYLFPSDNNYTEKHGTITARENIPIYNGDGYNVGYIKSGSTVSVTEGAEEVTWSRFVNPLEGTNYDYLYVLNEYVIVDGSTISTDEMVNEIIAEISQYAIETPVFLDAPTSDMEVHEFRVTNSKEISWKDGLFKELISISDSIEANLYKTFYIECEEDEDGEPYILCRVYYKEKVEYPKAEN